MDEGKERAGMILNAILAPHGRAATFALFHFQHDSATS
jgi:hypothetical protein